MRDSRSPSRASGATRTGRAEIRVVSPAASGVALGRGGGGGATLRVAEATTAEAWLVSSRRSSRSTRVTRSRTISRSACRSFWVLSTGLLAADFYGIICETGIAFTLFSPRATHESSYRLPEVSYPHAPGLRAHHAASGGNRQKERSAGRHGAGVGHARHRRSLCQRP